MERRGGAILVDRNLRDWWGWPNPFYVMAWLDLLMTAAHTAHTRDFQGTPVDVARGQLVTSLRILAKRWDVSVKRVRTFLAKLEKTGAIQAQQRAHPGTLLTIVNYDEYQTWPNRGGTAKGTRGAQQGHSRGTQKNKGERITTKENVELPPGLDEDAFKNVWVEWLAYRCENRWSTKPAWAKRQLAMLAEHGPAVAIAAINESMRQGWKGVFPNKIESKTTKTRNGNKIGPDGLEITDEYLH